MQAAEGSIDRVMDGWAKRTKAVTDSNEKQLSLWKLAVWLEAGLIMLVVGGGFAACTALAIAAQYDRAEKIAFALFGFIGGRGFLHIRALVMDTGKR
ncbi:hypothetical protein AWV80_21280 [Cupriavidus sp. UYMU48A]|nr:hypothetical protein AWV80_21280 [Cupriavidus sp. UYMU48A]